jgi:hypothetical protein
MLIASQVLCVGQKEKKGEKGMKEQEDLWKESSMRCDADRVSEWRVAAGHTTQYGATPDHSRMLDLDLLTGFKGGRSVCVCVVCITISIAQRKRFWDKRTIIVINMICRSESTVVFRLLSGIVSSGL